MIYTVLVNNAHDNNLIPLHVKAPNKSIAYKKVLNFIKKYNEQLGYEYYYEYNAGKEIKLANGGVKYDYSTFTPYVKLLALIE